MGIFFYNVLLTALAVVAAPVAVARAWWRGQPLRRVPERFGYLPAPVDQTGPGAIWLHAVSVGEALSCLPLARALRERLPRAPLYLTTSTPTGEKLAREKLGGEVEGVFYAPLDFAGSVARALRRLRPRLVIVAETEIWPNLFQQTKRFGAGLLLVNGRISDRSGPRYRRFRWFFGPVLALADRILTQSAIDARRFVDSGAPASRVGVGGNLKFDYEPNLESLPEDLETFFDRSGASPLIVAGSTREGEEAIVVDAFRQVCARHAGALLVVAPRHPQRFDEAADVVEKSRFPWARRSALPETLALPGILVLDSLGELSTLYRRADVVFVGGSLNGWGGHNVLEPAFHGKPVVVGPHMQNFRAIADEMAARGGLAQVSAAAELAAALERLISHPHEAREIAESGQRVAESHRGAARRAAEAAVEIYGRSVRVNPPRWWEILALGLFSSLWECAARLRVWAYGQGWLRRRHLDCSTVCVGNLTVGGAGKTPAVQWLTRQLIERGARPGILLRGYRRASRESQPLVLTAPNESSSDPGDEARLHLRALGSGVAVGIGGDRFASGTRLLAQYPADTLVLDDGFQHLRLARDCDIVLIDALNPFGNGWCLPLGRLRESPAALARAAAVVLTRCAPDRDVSVIEDVVRRHAPGVPIFKSFIEPTSLVDAYGGRHHALAQLGQSSVLAFCGIGNPEGFRQTLDATGACVVNLLAFPDHHRYLASDLEGIFQQARDCSADLIVCTEKDLLNLPPDFAAIAKAGDSRLYWLKTELRVEQGEQLIDLVWQALGRDAGDARTAKRRPPLPLVSAGGSA